MPPPQPARHPAKMQQPADTVAFSKCAVRAFAPRPPQEPGSKDTRREGKQSTTKAGAAVVVGTVGPRQWTNNKTESVIVTSYH